jgi:hypothetical protein
VSRSVCRPYVVSRHHARGLMRWLLVTACLVDRSPQQLSGEPVITLNLPGPEQISQIKKSTYRTSGR